MNPGNKIADRFTVMHYLVAAYQVDEVSAWHWTNVVYRETLIKEAERAISFAYYPGDKIAKIEGLIPRDDYDPDAEAEGSR